VFCIRAHFFVREGRIVLFGLFEPDSVTDEYISAHPSPPHLNCNITLMKKILDRPLMLWVIQGARKVELFS
jgi:hypothetical protein